MKTWYEAATWYRPEIKPVQVTKASNMSVYINGSRRARHTVNASIYETWEEAHSHLMRHTEQKLADARRALERAQSEHGNVKGMKKPESV